MQSLIRKTYNLFTFKERKIILGNFFPLASLQGLNCLLPIIVLPYLMRVIGPDRFGLIFFAQAFVQYFMILTDYGFNISATREIALHKQSKEKVSKIFSSAFTVKMIMAAASFLILLFVVNFIPKFKADWLIYVLSFGMVIGNSMFPAWFFQGIEEMKYTAILNIAGGLVYILGVFLLVRAQQDYFYVPMVGSVISLTTGIFGLYIAFKEFDLSFVQQRYEDIKERLRTGWDIFVSIVAINAYTNTRIFAIGFLTNNTITGYYAIAEKIASFIQTFPLDSLSQSIYPRLNSIFQQNKRRAIKLMLGLQGSVTFSYIISLPVYFILAPLIINIACGAVYFESLLTLRLLLIPVFFVSMNVFRVQFLLISGKPDIYAKIHVSMALLGCPLLFLFIHLFSYLGAVLSVIIIEAAIFLLTRAALRGLIQKFCSVSR